MTCVSIVQSIGVMMIMTFDDFTRYVLTSFPEAVIDEDGRTGELIIHTNQKLDGEQIVRLDDEKPF